MANNDSSSNVMCSSSRTARRHGRALIGTPGTHRRFCTKVDEGLPDFPAALFFKSNCSLASSSVSLSFKFGPRPK
jgi:hypothetical protein